MLQVADGKRSGNDLLQAEVHGERVYGNVLLQAEVLQKLIQGFYGFGFPVGFSLLVASALPLR